VILYIHGFNSSSASFKARVLQQKMAGSGVEFVAPDLPHWPLQAIAQLEALIGKAGDAVTLVGSSLGGYYATWLAEKHGLKAVLINPAVRPYELMSDFLGPKRNLYTGERYELTSDHLSQLRQLEVPVITRPERYLLIVGTQDEVLDYRQALARYSGAKQILVEDGDHGLSNFADYVGRIMDFASI
jgi:predicted esterase YcpF (UPF0227 family)